MVNLNTNIPLMGQGVNVLGNMAQGTQLASQQIAMQDAAQRKNLFAQHGAGLLSGDQNALNALAGVDPMAALQIRSQHQSMAISQERIAMAREQTRRALAEAEDQREAQREAQEAVTMGQRAMAAFQSGDERAWSMMTREFTGGTPLPMSREGVALLQSIVTGSADYMAMLPEQGKPLSNLAKLRADFEAGLIDPATFEAAVSKATAVDGLRIKSDGAGGFEMVQGAGAATGGKGLNEIQSKNAVFATRAKGALQQLNQVVDGDPLSDQMTSRKNRYLDAVPLGLGREMQSGEYQVAAAAGQEFLQAILRKDTGAAITDQEQILYGRLYLPQPGDTAEVLAYRKQARDRAVAALEAGMTPEAARVTELALAQQAGVKIFGEAHVSEVAEGGQSGANPFAGVTQEQFRSIDLNQLSPEQIDQLFEAMNQ